MFVSLNVDLLKKKIRKRIKIISHFKNMNFQNQIYFPKFEFKIVFAFFDFKKQ